MEKIFDINGIELTEITINNAYAVPAEQDSNENSIDHYTPRVAWTIPGSSGTSDSALTDYLKDNVMPTKEIEIQKDVSYSFGFSGYSMQDDNNNNFKADYNFKRTITSSGSITNNEVLNTTIGALNLTTASTDPTYFTYKYYEWHVLVHTTRDNRTTIAHVGIWYGIYGGTSIARRGWHAYGINGTWGGVEYNINNMFTTREQDTTDDTTIGGGYGLGSMPTDNISIPELPLVDMSDTGATLYSLTPLQMKKFRSWLWTTDWVENLKKIRTDPMQNIIGISIADIPIVSGLNALVYVGNVASTVEANLISNSFVELDCGEISLEEYYGSFADYEPFIATTLYLPKVGFVQIPADVCVNNTIKVVYHIELSSGEGLCYVQLTSKRDGFTYIWNTYTCHVTSNITLSAQDHSQQLVALGNAIINTGISASNAIVNPTSAAQGLTNTLSSCIDVATTKNPTSTKGNVGNMSAAMCYKKPYLLINRTNLTKPSSFQENNGYLINYTATIGNHTGFLQTRNYHCSFNAPYNHRAEIERLMDGGIIINA